MADGGVASGGLHLKHSTFVGAANKGFLDASMLIAEMDFQVVSDLAVALEPRVAWFVNAGVDGADGDFMDFLAVHDEILVLGIFCGGRVEVMLAHRFEPVVALGPQACLLKDFALKGMGLRTVKGKGREAAEGCCREDGEGVLGVVGEDRPETHAAIIQWLAEESCNTRSTGNGTSDI